MSEAILEVRDLRTQFPTDEGVVHAVDGVSFTVSPGETLGIVGESGSGKSITGMSVMRLVPPPGKIVDGEIRFEGRDLLALSSEEMRQLRGGDVAMIFQDPMTSLNPLFRISNQLIEAMVVHGKFGRKEASERALDLLSRMGITSPERAVRSFPYQFSGGMRQRVMLAMGFGNKPSLLIADEPTTALDVTIQAQLLDLLRGLNQEQGVAIILISHDLGVVASICSRIVVMYAGQIVEEGPTDDLLSRPQHPYTWALINAVPRLDRAGTRRLVAIEGMPPDPLRPPAGCRFAARCPFRIAKCDEQPPLVEMGPGRRAACWVTQSGGSLAGSPIATGSSTAVGTPGPEPATKASSDGRKGSPILELRDVVKHFPLPKRQLLGGRAPVVRAVDGVSFTVAEGETVGLVGESGSGKSTLARTIVRLYEPTRGEVVFNSVDISHIPESQMRPHRRRLQMIFQDPYSSLNTRMKVRKILSEPLEVHHLTGSREETERRVLELLNLVGLPRRSLDLYPHEFSGGQRQRIGVARALAMDPSVVVADEPISSLDVNIQAQVINLLEDLQDELGLTYLFIAHDLSVVRHLSDRIVVLYLGKIMELANKGDLFDHPLHPYTRALISAVPVADVTTERNRERVVLHGEIPDAINPPSGCRFRTRCPVAQGICAEVEPPLVEHEPGRLAACHFPGSLN